MDNNDSHNPTTTQARLLHIRKNILKLSRSEVFKKYNIPVDTLASWELGRNNVSEKVLEQIIQIYNAEGILVDKEWLRTGNGLHPQLLFDLNRYFKKRPIVFEDNTPSDEILLIKEIEFFTSLTSNSIIALISTEDMLPIYSIGDYVGGRFRPKNQLGSCIGRDCIIKTLNICEREIICIEHKSKRSIAFCIKRFIGKIVFYNIN